MVRNHHSQKTSYDLTIMKRVINSSYPKSVIRNSTKLISVFSGWIYQEYGLVIPKRPYKRAKQVLLHAYMTRFGVSYDPFCKSLSVSILESRTESIQPLGHKPCKFDGFLWLQDQPRGHEISNSRLGIMVKLM